MALASVSARYPQPSRMMRTRGFGQDKCNSWLSGHVSWSCLLQNRFTQTDEENLPDQANWVSFQVTISRDHRQALFHGLRNEHSVEGIAMVHRETFKSQQMIGV